MTTRPSTDLRPPGVYSALAESPKPPFDVADTRIAGFVGLSQKGPLDEPVRISSWDEFLETYGYDTEHYLSDSVEAFFRNGGRTCHVVRVAHRGKAGAPPALDEAASADYQSADEWAKPTLRVRARSEGRWGNDIWVSFEQTTGARALLTKDLDFGSGGAQVSTTRGFWPGALVRIYDREQSDYVILSEVEDRMLRWDADTPVNHRHRAAAPTYVEVVEFDLHVTLRERKEVFRGLQLNRRSHRYAPWVVERESRLVRLDDLESPSPPAHALPEPMAPTKLSAGRDGSAALTPEDVVGRDTGPADRTGLMSLVVVDEVVQLVCPDAMLFVERSPGPEGVLRTQRVQDAMVDLCENSKQRFAILDCPETRSVDAVRRWRRRVDSSFCAFYWPWIGMSTRSSPARMLPPSGVVAGVYAGVETDQGVHFAPANVAIRDAVDVSVPVTEDDLGLLNSDSVNVIRLARGIRVWGARTASSDPDWRHVNIRRLFIMLRRSLELGMAWVPFEYNNHKTWKSLEDMVRSFLEGLYARGMFAGGKPEDCFYVRCNQECNPPEVVDQGQLICEIGIAPAVPAEFLMISLVENMGSEG